MSFLPSKRFSFYLCMVLCCQSFGPSTQGAWLWSGVKDIANAGYSYVVGNGNNIVNEDDTNSDDNDSSDGNQSQNNDTDNSNINIQGNGTNNQNNTNNNGPFSNDPFTNFMAQYLYPNGVPGSNNTNNNNANPNNTIVNDEPGHNEAEAQRRQKQAYYYAYCLDEEEVGDKDKALTLDQEKKGTVTSAYVLGVVMVSYVVSKFLPSLGPPKQGQRARS